MANLLDIGKNLFSGASQAVGNFLQQYPTPESYVAKQVQQVPQQIQQRVVQPIQQSIQNYGYKNPVQSQNLISRYEPTFNALNTLSQPTYQAFSQGIPAAIRTSPLGQFTQYATGNVPKFQNQISDLGKGLNLAVTAGGYKNLASGNLLNPLIQTGVGAGMGALSAKMNGQDWKQGALQMAGQTAKFSGAFELGSQLLKPLTNIIAPQAVQQFGQYFKMLANPEISDLAKGQIKYLIAKNLERIPVNAVKAMIDGSVGMGLVGATQPFKTVGEWLNNIAENAKQGAVFAGATSLVGPLADFGIQGAKSKYNAIPNKEAGFIKIKGNPAESPTTPPASVGESRGVPSTGGEIVQFNDLPKAKQQSLYQQFLKEGNKDTFQGFSQMMQSGQDFTKEGKISSAWDKPLSSGGEIGGIPTPDYVNSILNKDVISKYGKVVKISEDVHPGEYILYTESGKPLVGVQIPKPSASSQGVVGVGEGVHATNYTPGQIVNLGSDGVAKVISNDNGKIRVIFPGQEKFPVILNEKGLSVIRTATPKDIGTIKPGSTPKKMTLRMWQNELSSSGGEIPKGGEPMATIAPEATSPTMTKIAGEKQRGFVTSVQNSPEVSPDVQGKVSGTYGVATDKAALEQSANLTTDLPSATNTVLDQLNSKTSQITKQTISDAIAVAKAQDAQGNTAMATQIYDKVAEHLTNSGQVSQAASLLSQRTPEGLLYSATKALKTAGVERTPEIEKQLNGLIGDIKATQPGSDEQSMATQKLVKFVTDKIPRSKGNALFGIWRSMLISGPETAAKVATSYGINTPGQLLSRPISALTDRVVSGLTGSDRSITFNPSDYKTFGQGFVEGAKAIPTKMTTGLDLPDTSSFNGYDNPAESMNRSSQQTGVEKVVTRVHASIPKPIYEATYDMNIAEQARTEALNAGKSGDKGFIQDLIDHPTNKMKDIARVEAEKATNMASNAATKASSAVQNIPVIGKILNPIARVPANIGVQGLIDYSPLGLVKAGGEVVRGIIKGDFNQRDFSTAVGKGTVGTAIMATGAALMNAGRMALAQPADAKERALNEAQNIPANSVYVGGKVTKDANGTFQRSGGTWISLNATGAAGITLALGGGVAKGGPAAGLAAGGRELADQPYVQGIAGFGQALSDPTRYASTFLDKTATSVIPGLVAQPARGTDTVQRAYSSNLVDALKAKIPGLRQTLPAERNLYGQTLPGSNPNGTVLGGIAGTVNPFYPQSSMNQNDPVTSELQRLYNVGGSAGSPAISAQTKNQTIQGVKMSLTPTQLSTLISQEGPQIHDQISQIISNPGYQSLSDENKTNAINSVLTSIRKQVRGNIDLSQTNQPIKIASPTSGQYTLINKDTGSVKQINLSQPISYPTLTGNTIIDKKLVSSYKSDLNSRTNDIISLYQDGQLTLDQANTAIQQVKDSTSSGIKASKKITISKSSIKAPLISISKSKVTNFKMPALPKIKQSKSTAIKIKNLKPTKFAKIKGLTIGKKLV